jgi:hypothetical protein
VEVDHTVAGLGIRPVVGVRLEEVAVGRIDQAVVLRTGLGLVEAGRTVRPVEADRTVHLVEVRRTDPEEVHRHTDLGVVHRTGLEEAVGRSLAEVRRRTDQEERRNRQVRGG